MTPSTPIAVIGIGGRFPGADGVEPFWTLLRDGRDAVGPVTHDRWDTLAQHANRRGDRDAAARSLPPAWGFVDRGDCFDAALFGISEREAERMDPQQGFVLEVAWQALEDAGIAPDGLAGSRTGAFVGVSTRDFDRRLADHWELADVRAATGSSGAVIANRLSYALGLRGPSLSVDAACASSLAAVHLACQALRLGECDLALAGGVQLILSPANMVAFSRGGLLARDGRTKCFAAAADGYACGEGGGAVVLRRLDDAVRSRDRIRALIGGSAMNHNGASNGLSAPFGKAQEEVIRAALAAAAFAPASIGCVEAHSAGTLLGDAIEVKALKAALSHGRTADDRCLIGSVKSNIGHLEAAAGIASLLKAILALERGFIPGTLHCEPLSGHLRLSGSPLQVAVSGKSWLASGSPRRAGVSAFSFGGGNAHVVLEEPPQRQPPACGFDRTTWMLPLSACSAESLRALATKYVAALTAFSSDPNPRAAFAHLCFTASTGRAHLTHRVAVVSNHPADARRQLQAFLANRPDGWRAGCVETRGEPDTRSCNAGMLAEAYVAGRVLDWRACFDDAAYERLPAPTYAFQRRRHWKLPDAADVNPSARDRRRGLASSAAC